MEVVASQKRSAIFNPKYELFAHGRCPLKTRFAVERKMSRRVYMRVGLTPAKRFARFEIAQLRVRADHQLYEVFACD